MPETIPRVESVPVILFNTDSLESNARSKRRSLAT